LIPGRTLEPGEPVQAAGSVGKQHPTLGKKKSLSLGSFQ